MNEKNIEPCEDEESSLHQSKIEGNHSNKSLDWNAFPKDWISNVNGTGKVKIFPFEENKVYIMGFSRKSIDPVNFNEGNGMLPTLRVYVDRVDNDPPLGQRGFAISSRSKYLISKVKYYEDEGMLYTHMFRVKKYKDTYIKDDGTEQEITTWSFEVARPRSRTVSDEKNVHGW